MEGLELTSVGLRVGLQFRAHGTGFSPFVKASLHTCRAASGSVVHGDPHGNPVLRKDKNTSIVVSARGCSVTVLDTNIQLALVEIMIANSILLRLAILDNRNGQEAFFGSFCLKSKDGRFSNSEMLFKILKFVDPYHMG